GAELGHLTWQTSDRAENHAAIHAWLREAGLPNVVAPLRLDVLQHAMRQTFDGIYSANTSHIMSIAAVEKMFSLASLALPQGGKFLLYGPFRQGGSFNMPSNEKFHRGLREQDPSMGIRHLEFLDELAVAGDLCRQRLYAMPANNHIVVWVKQAAEKDY
ncbi:MAG: class I SAM-dependent methyltransferase, partial [Gammaproteobacteria bacterium]|nr:class I SAM-dependent methyltransferase [Gammaproteobacteria bacterium]